MPEIRETPIEKLREGFENLCSAKVLDITPILGGGNNRLFRLQTETGLFAGKCYPLPIEGSRDRLGREFEALEFLQNQEVCIVPRPISRNDEAGLGLYEWIEGTPVGTVDEQKVDAALGFIKKLKTLSGQVGSETIAPAVESSLAAADLLEQIDQRISKLNNFGRTESTLCEFLENRLAPVYNYSRMEMRKGFKAQNWDEYATLLPASQTLSPSDFGFHNAIRRNNGEIVFIDFEYFGWDDPIRVTSDFVLHPGMKLDAAARHRYLRGAIELYDSDPGFRYRLKLLFPLVAVRWCLIMLNEFLPEFRKRRDLLGCRDSQELVKRRQLKKAYSLWASLNKRMKEVFCEI